MRSRLALQQMVGCQHSEKKNRVLKRQQTNQTDCSLGNWWERVSLPLQSLAGPICVIIESKSWKVNFSPQQTS